MPQVIYLETATCHFQNSDTRKQFPSLAAAREAAESYVGNNAFSKPFAHEDTYFYGPGDGTCSVMVRRDVDYEATKAEWDKPE